MDKREERPECLEAVVHEDEEVAFEEGFFEKDREGQPVEPGLDGGTGCLAKVSDSEAGLSEDPEGSVCERTGDPESIDPAVCALL